jgi:prolyl-tRNA synthetase
MRWSNLFIPTLREVPADAEVASHRLMLRAGYVRQLSAGIYSYLFLAQRSLVKIQNIIREEMDAIGGQEMLLPALHPAEVWQESGRWDVMGDNMFRLKDRFGRQLCLGMTHEEIMTVVARGELRSYKQLPQIWYQIQTKFRDEPRPKSGLLRVRQFIMKDSYSFDVDAKGLDASFDKHYEAYCRIFDRCGLKYFAVQADSGSMGGSASNEFMVVTDAGEDLVVYAPESKYYANLEKAVSTPVPPVVPDPEGDWEPEEFHTPGKKSIADVSAFDGLPAASHIKSVVVVGDDGKMILALLRGDHELSETKFNAAAGIKEFRPAQPEEIRAKFGAEPGSLGPVGISEIRVIADKALEGRKNMVAGANKTDYHLKNVTPGKDFTAPFADIRQSAPGDTCVGTGEALQFAKAMEVGHIFKLGYKYSDSMGLRCLGEDGKEFTPIMGSYGIGVERILCGAIELYHDKDGMAMPTSIAPFEVVITPTNMGDAAMKDAAGKLYSELKAAGVDVLFDDRDERPGVKFKDSDLIGIPYRITVGKKLAEGKVEIVERQSKQVSEALVGEAAGVVAGMVKGAK